jgi:DNA replication protein DnaC
METTMQLKTNLKDLRLFSMYENIDNNIKMAIESKMSYNDLLLLLTQGEIDRRKNQKKERLLKSAKLGKIKHITDFDFDFNPIINRHKILNLTNMEFIKNNENIIFYGNTGVGKTHLAKALGYEACNKNYKVIFTRTARMLEIIYSGKADNTYQKKLDNYIKCDLLILDDFGMTRFENKMLNILNELLSERSENGSIIITSNRDIISWSELFEEKVIASALIDRLFYKAHLIKITGKSYRTNI